MTFTGLTFSFLLFFFAHVLCLQKVNTTWGAVEQTWYPKRGWRPLRWPLWLWAPSLSVGRPITCWGSGTGSNQTWSSTRLNMCTTSSLFLAIWTHALTQSSMASTRHLFGLTLLMCLRAAILTRPKMACLAPWIVWLLMLELLWRWIKISPDVNELCYLVCITITITITCFCFDMMNILSR